MEISINCGTFARLAKLARRNESGFLRSVWLECLDGKLIAVATDKKIMAIEFLGLDNGPDFSMNAVVDDALVNQCEIEKSFDSNLKFVFNHTLNYTTAVTNFGYSHVGNAALANSTTVGTIKAEDNLLSIWRTCLPDELPKISNGGIFMDTAKLQILAETSPSGVIIFPEKIDVDKPVVVNDVHDPNWIGLFLSKPSDNEPPDEVMIPGWVR